MSRKLEQLKSNIFDPINANIPEPSVNSSVFIDSEGDATHAAITYRIGGQTYLFHYTGEEVQTEILEENKYNAYQTQLTFIDDILITSFVAHCSLIQENAQPRYGFFYNGGLYDNQGNYIAPGTIPEYMTCVGFCLSVIKGFIRKDFIDYTDWDHSNLSEEFIDRFWGKYVNPYFPEITLEQFKADSRRILPIEYFVATFSSNNELPVSKKSINKKISDITDILKSKVA